MIAMGLQDAPGLTRVRDNHGALEIAEQFSQGLIARQHALKLLQIGPDLDENISWAPTAPTPKGFGEGRVPFHGLATIICTEFSEILQQPSHM